MKTNIRKEKKTNNKKDMTQKQTYNI